MKAHYRVHLRLCGPGRRAPAHVLIARAITAKFQGRTAAVVIAVGGPGGTGKSTFAARLAAQLPGASVLALDDYKTSREARAAKRLQGPHPEANEIALLKDHLLRLRRGEAVEKPVYCRRRGLAAETELFPPARFIIAEGEIATYPDFYRLVDFSVFIDSHWWTQLRTRIGRDIVKRGYSVRKALTTYVRSNLLEFRHYGAESRNWADVHIHCDSRYRLRIDAVCSRSVALI
ncbi:MAG: AAA family ATPase [Elusimicrobiales bacterium]|nr:AAA family ATPase [Elusimicrobiales bacterium]